jgi:hypothetical protein
LAFTCPCYTSHQSVGRLGGAVCLWLWVWVWVWGALSLAVHPCTPHSLPLTAKGANS